jgi:UDP-N-acetylglucosamine:LPS N-acetylglucosamine transferase
MQSGSPLVAPRFLVLTAEVGLGHTAAAAALEQGLLRESPRATVDVLDALLHMGRPLRFLLLTAYRWQLRWAPWLFGLLHHTLMRGSGDSRVWRRLLWALGGRSLARAIERVGPDVIISTYPPATNLVGEMQLRGRLAIPACATITDIGGVALWAHPGIALHLIAHPDLERDVEHVAGLGSARVVRPLIHPKFHTAPSRADARAALSLGDGPVVLVSGGGWGVGDLEGAVQEALRLTAATVVCLTGRNARLLRRLGDRYGDEQRLILLGFTEEMPALLAAADAIVHSTGGVTVLEALASGCPVIAYGGVRGHLPELTRRMNALGIVRAATAATLRSALEETIRLPAPPLSPLLQLPDAAFEIVSLAFAD